MGESNDWLLALIERSIDAGRRNRVARERQVASLLGVPVERVEHRVAQLSADGVCRTDLALDLLILDGQVLADGHVWVEGADDD